MKLNQVRQGQQLLGIFLLGILLFNFPLIALFNVSATVFGLPVLYVYIFCVWLALIGLTYLVIERSTGEN